MILLLRSSGILASIQCANNRMSYRQLTIITMEQEYRNRASKRKKYPQKWTFARHIKEVVISANPSFRKTIVITKSRENFLLLLLLLLFLIELCVQLICFPICNLRQFHLLKGKLVWLRKNEFENCEQWHGCSTMWICEICILFVVNN